MDYSLYFRRIMELGLGVWMSYDCTFSDRMGARSWTSVGYYRDLSRFDKRPNLIYLIVL